MSSGILSRVAKGAAIAFGFAIIMRIVLGGYGGPLEFMLLLAFRLGPLLSVLPALVSLAFVLWWVFKKRFPEAIGAGLVVAAGIGVPLLMLQLSGPTANTATSQLLPKGAVIVFGDDIQCYGSTACGSEIVRAGYVVAATNGVFGSDTDPVQGDQLSFTSFQDGPACQDKLKSYSTGFSLPAECTVWRQDVLGDTFVFLRRTIDPATDAETYQAFQNGKVIAAASRVQVQRYTYSPYFVLGKLRRTEGLQRKQDLITALTGVALGD